MRVILVGAPAACARLRAEIDGALEVVAEFPALGVARAAAIEADAFVVAPADDRGEAAPYDEPLTPRERQVLELLAEGLTNKGIASRLGISDQTVKFHVASVSGKLHAANRTDVVRRAAQRGLLTL